MAESGTGAIFTQSGVGVKGSADYQRVFDSRWKFMEIEFDRPFKVSLPARPAVDPTRRYDDRINIVKHNLGFIPLFETDFPDQRYQYAMLSGASMYADDQYIFLQRFVTNLGAEAQELSFNIRVYNLDVTKDYVAPKTLPQGTQSPRSTIGVKFLDGQAAGVDIGDNAPQGFSVDSTKKILSIHRHGVKEINAYSNQYLSATAVDTTADTLTIAPSPGASSVKAQDISWAQVAGTPIIYTPNNFSAASLPGGIPASTNGVNSAVIYTIPVDSTHIKVATSYNNALAGVAIDLTSGGSLPGSVNGTSVSGDLSNAILHDVGYPPTFLLARIESEMYVNGVGIATPNYIEPLADIIVGRVSADTRYLYFAGIQALFAGVFAYVIMKDPAELAA